MNRSSPSGRGSLDVQEMQHTLDALIERAVQGGDAPGVVAAVAQGASVVVSTAGLMALDGPAMRRDTTRFRITSMTKPMSAAVVLALVDQGVLRLDEPIDELLPELANPRVLRRRTPRSMTRSRRHARSRPATCSPSRGALECKVRCSWRPNRGPSSPPPSSETCRASDLPNPTSHRIPTHGWLASVNCRSLRSQVNDGCTRLDRVDDLVVHQA